MIQFQDSSAETRSNQGDNALRCWTDWFDRDNPSGTGDWESLSLLRRENPGKICRNPSGIEVQTLSGLSLLAAGDVSYRNDPIRGFVCRNRDQPGRKMCNDFRVRFVCYPPYCGGGVCWTKWYDRDNPSGSGDWEQLYRQRQMMKSKDEICEFPLYIEAVTNDKEQTPALKTGQKFFAPTEGFICRNKDQRNGKCRDYKVRYGCPCKH
uniref:Cartilage intermediate layer protein 2-like n=1 Tax=Acanthochromis polyacanthus TaxID=80966 RepID=A0A3Q1F505_9TELE